MVDDETERAAAAEVGGAAEAAPGRVLIAVPTYNEAANVAPLTAKIRAVAPRAEVLFVDDASPDGTAREVRALTRRDRRVHLLSRPAKLGLGTAYLAGFEAGLAGGFDAVVTLDADLSHDPAYLPALLAAAARYDLVVGSRYVPGGGIENWPLRRRLLSRMANAYARGLLRLPLRDCTSGFRVYRAAVLRALPLAGIRSSGYSFLEEIAVLAARRGFRLGEIPIVFVDREGGRSKISTGEILLAVYHTLRLAVLPATRRTAQRHPAALNP